MSTVIKEPSNATNTQAASDVAVDAVDAAKNHWLGLHKETRRTACYAATACVCLAITFGVEFANRPAAIKEYGRVGQEFYPEFRDPTLATGLTVATIDPEELSSKTFSVERADNGQWVIPSHHNYPADAEDQLAKTASSVIGIERGALVTRWNADHARYGVVNPQTDAVEVDEIEGIGRRLTLKADNDSILVDYIIGNAVGDSTNEYYVRHPEEDEVYIAKLNIDLSTQFSDWINTDLLNINNWDVRSISLNDYKFDELQGTVTEADFVSLSRESSTDDWELRGINDNQQVNSDALQETLNTLTSLNIIGVRPKQRGLTPDLKLDRSSLGSQRDVDRLQSDLLARGFLLQPVEGGSADDLKLIAREGELSTATEDGLVYNLYFGRAFTGSNDELEFGLGSDSDEDADPASNQTIDDENSSNESDSADTGNPTDTPQKADVSKPGRYVFVTVKFDQALLGPEPVEPAKPEKPEELIELEAATADATQVIESQKSESPTESRSDSKAGESFGSEQTESDTGNSSEQAKRLAELRNEFEAAEKQYADDKQAHEDFLKKVQDGKKKAEELNRRFANWYYVISGDEYDRLALTRNDVTKDMESDIEETAEETADDDNTPSSEADESPAGTPQDKLSLPSKPANDAAVVQRAAESDAPEAELDPETGDTSTSNVGEAVLGNPDEADLTPAVDGATPSAEAEAEDSASLGEFDDASDTEKDAGEVAKTVDANPIAGPYLENRLFPLVQQPKQEIVSQVDPLSALLNNLRFDIRKWLTTDSSRHPQG